MDTRDLQHKLNYLFDDQLLLQQALTHRSHSGNNNERLEYLGDSLLSSIISATLYHNYPDADEGRLSRMRAWLVKKDTLAGVARQLDLSIWVRLGDGERKSGGQDRDSILADSIEAVIAAIYLDSGSYQITSKAIGKMFATLINQLDAIDQFKDSKSLLQEWLQARGLHVPKYQITSKSANPLQPHFVVSCEIAGLSDPVCASGQSKRLAEQQAARAALTLLRQQE